MATILNNVVVAVDRVLITRKPLPDGVTVNSNDVHIGEVVKAGSNVTYYANCIIGYQAAAKEVIQFVLNNNVYFLVPADKIIFGIAP